MSRIKGFWQKVPATKWAAAELSKSAVFYTFIFLGSCTLYFSDVVPCISLIKKHVFLWLCEAYFGRRCQPQHVEKNSTNQLIFKSQTKCSNCPKVMNKENSQCRNKGKYERHRRTHCKISAATFLWFIKCLISGIKDAIVLQIQNSQQALVQVLRRELGATLTKVAKFWEFKHLTLLQEQPAFSPSKMLHWQKNAKKWKVIGRCVALFSVPEIALAKNVAETEI